MLPGSCRSHRDTTENDGETLGVRSACVVWTGAVDKDGYPAGRRHRKVLEAKLGRKLTSGEQARHVCDNPPCMNPDHLNPGTRFDNIADREKRGRTAAGEAIPWAKLTAAQVASIVRLGATNLAGPREMATVYRVSSKTITDILGGRRWNVVTGLPRVRKPIPYSERGEIRRTS